MAVNHKLAKRIREASCRGLDGSLLPWERRRTLPKTEIAELRRQVEAEDARAIAESAPPAPSSVPAGRIDIDRVVHEAVERALAPMTSQPIREQSDVELVALLEARTTATRVGIESAGRIARHADARVRGLSEATSSELGTMLAPAPEPSPFASPSAPGDDTGRAERERLAAVSRDAATPLDQRDAAFDTALTSFAARNGASSPFWAAR